MATVEMVELMTAEQFGQRPDPGGGEPPCEPDFLRPGLL